MRTETINNTEIKFYNSINEMPEWRWQKMQYFTLQHEGIGSTLVDANRHIDKIMEFCKAGKMEEAFEERYNLHFNLNAIQNGTSSKTLVLACLVESINGDPVDIATDDGMRSAHDRLLKTDITTGHIDLLLEELKKKFHDELKLYFPGMADEDLNRVDILRKYLSAHAEHGLNPSEDWAELIEKLHLQMLDLDKPLQFRIVDGSNVIIERQKEFDRGCMSIKESGIQDAREMTMYDFRILIEIQQQKAQKQQHGTTELS